LQEPFKEAKTRKVILKILAHQKAEKFLEITFREVKNEYKKGQPISV